MPAPRKRPLTKEELLAEYNRREQVKLELEGLLFDKQLQFIRDPSKKKAIFCPRRSGKSWVLGAYLILQALIYPGRKNLYIGLNQASAENTIWDQILEVMLDKLKVQYTYNKNKKTITLKNKSTIRFAGSDASPKEMKKLLGGKYHLVIIDECQDVTQDLRHMVIEDIGPAVSDYIKKDGGIIVLAGTPGTKMGEHYWFQITKQDSQGNPHPDRLSEWAVHEWHVMDNPYMAEEFGITCESWQKDRGDNYQEDPSFRRQWLAQWVLDESRLVYKYDPSRNKLEDIDLKRKLLNRQDKDFTYLLGCDLGWEDATAIVIGAYSAFDKCFYIVESSKHNHTNIATIAGLLIAYKNKYQIGRMILDTGGGGKLAAESLREQYLLPIYAAEKQEKESSIARMNSDLICSMIKVIEETNKDLVKEWNELQVDPKAMQKGVFKEADKFQNHLADAALYAFKDALHFYGKTPAVARQPDFADLLLQRKRQLRPIRDKEDYDLFDRLDEQQEARDIVRRFRGE